MIQHLKMINILSDTEGAVKFSHKGMVKNIIIKWTGIESIYPTSIMMDLKEIP